MLQYKGMFVKMLQYKGVLVKMLLYKGSVGEDVYRGACAAYGGCW